MKINGGMTCIISLYNDLKLWDLVHFVYHVSRFSPVMIGTDEYTMTLYTLFSLNGFRQHERALAHSQAKRYVYKLT